ncbi:MAG: S8 family peptidase [Sphingomonadales bacterium]
MLSLKKSPLIRTIALLSLGACQGSGQGNEGGPTTPNPQLPTPPPSAYAAPDIPTISTSDLFNTPEFKMNYGLQAMNTHTIYGQGISGEGILVAVIDDGIDLEHPDLKQNISPLSLDIVTGNYKDVDVNSNNTHGTQLAGIIAGAKNDIGIHGVAYNATILSIKAIGENYHTVGDIAKSIDYAVENGAKIINLSITYATLPTDLKESMDRAVDAGVLIVISAGNSLPSSLDRASLDAISAYATLPSSNGQAMAVGAIDRSMELSYFSNRPGEDGKNVYLLAPGVDIITTTVGGGVWVLSPEPDPQFFGIDLDASGTSFAAPHVAGAAALMFEMFPNLTAREVVELLLTGSTDVGLAGVDAITGYGIINLENSIQPQGTMSIPMGKTSMALNVPMSKSLLLSSPAFGDAFFTSEAFEGGFFQDKYRRAYKYDFRALTPLPEINISLGGQIKAHTKNRTISATTSANTRLQFNVKEIHWWEKRGGQSSQIEGDIFSGRKITTSSFISYSKITPLTSIEVRHGFQNEPLEDFALDLPETVDLNFGVTHFGLNDLRGFGTSINTKQQITEDSEVAVSFSSNNLKNNFRTGYQNNTGLSMRFKGRVTTKLLYGIELGYLSESDAFLKSQSFGAFGGFQNSTTSFGTIAASYTFKKVSFFGLYSMGTTNLNQKKIGFLNNFSTIKSKAFKGGVVVKKPLNQRGHLTFTIAQPLRVSSGTALVDIATGLNAEDEITRELRTISLSPRGRELNYSIAYKVDLNGFSLRANFLHRSNPSHIENINSDTAFLFHITSVF